MVKCVKEFLLTAKIKKNIIKNTKRPYGLLINIFITLHQYLNVIVMKDKLSDNKTVGEIVALDFRAAAIFREAGIDFCCGGRMGFSETCTEKGINEAELRNKIDELSSMPSDTTHNFKDWNPGFLCDYIVNTHHKYVLRTLPELVFYTAKISDVHGANHEELHEVASLFAQINKELLQHLENEEKVFFPAVKEFEKSGSKASQETIISEIKRLSGEHEFAGGAMDKINIITKGYAVPADGCNTYHVTFRLLQQFEDDLHIHVHLENNVLFPKLLKSVN
jgi:regulator of cell morphogenesis and NO signaling